MPEIFISYAKKVLPLGVISLPLTYVLGVIARSLYFNPRPFMVSGVEPLISHAADNGFPSDHTLLLASIASLVFIAVYFVQRVCRVFFLPRVPSAS